MANLTRIKNNQITDSTVNASSKLQNYSITSNKIANSLVYGSDLTVSGNLTVNGTTTTVDTVNTLIADPILTLADGQTAGAPTVDIGLLGLRGSSLNSFIGWKESANTFVAALSNTSVSNTTANITAYADFRANNIVASGNLSITGNITGSANFAGNVSAGNLLTTGVVSATGNISAGSGSFFIGNGSQLTGVAATTATALTNGTTNITTAPSGNANVTIAGTSNVVVFTTGGELVTGYVSATGNVTGGNVLTSGLVSATGNATAGNILTAGLVSATGNATAGNVLTSGLVSATGTATVGNLATGGNVSATANITGGNVLTGGLISATGNILGGNILTVGLISAAGNITSATNVNTPNVVATGNLSLSGGNILLTPTSGNVVLPGAATSYINNLAQPVNSNDAASKIYVDNAVSTQIAYHQPVVVATVSNLATATGGTITYNNGANGIGANITTTGSFNLIDSANVQTANTRILVQNEGNAALNGVYVWSNATVITRSTDTDTYGPNSTTDLSINDYFFVQSGNVNKGSAYVCDAPTGVITFGTSNISFAQFSSSQTYTAGNAISLYGTVISTVYDNSTIGVNGSNQLYIPANAPLTTPNIGAATGTSLSVTGTVTATTLSSTGNTIAGNVTTAGLVSATGNVTGGNLVTGGLVSSTGNVTGGNVLTGGIVSATGNATAGNLLTGGLVSSTGNVTGGNLLTAGLISATSTITSSANITGGNLLTGGLVSSTGNVTGGNLLTGGLISATSTITSAANITGGNIRTGGLVSATGTGTFGNIQIGPDSINDIGTNQTITVNSTNANTNFAVSGALANVFFVNASTNTASFGSNAQTTNAIVAFNATNSILMPAGNTNQRPSTGATGMLRFNSTLNSLELYNNSAWTTVGATVFTVIADEQFNGDGANVAFTLGSTQTTNSCIVSINGVVQVPTTAYSVSGTSPTCVLTFTEAPASGDLIDVREITTTTTVTSITNASGNAIILANATAAQIDVTGNLVPTGNATANIGSATNQFNTVFAKATSAQYADLAEMYAADAAYVSGTVVSFGGANEVTQSNTDADRRVAGVVSTNPSYIMNAGQAGDNVVAVALTGRVPTKVTGAVSKGDLMVSNGDGTARSEQDPKIGTVIGKALEDFTGTTGTIEVVVGRF